MSLFARLKMRHAKRLAQSGLDGLLRSFCNDLEFAVGAHPDLWWDPKETLALYVGA